MNLAVNNYNYKCDNCGNIVNESKRLCQVCNEDAGAPNVRACSCKENIDALNTRFDKQIEYLIENDKLELYEELSKKLRDILSVVIAMPPRIARNLFEDKNQIYNNYESLVGANVRLPADLKNSSQRGMVSSLIFGDYKDQIVYGALSINNFGLSTYGSAHCKLSNNTIKKRTTFLESNSYKFVEKYNLGLKDQIPLGYTSNWEKKEILVLLKLSNYIIGSSESDEILDKVLYTDKKNRENDEFIEAHIYGDFNSQSIQNIEYDGEGTRQDKLDMDLLKSFNK